MPSAPQTPPSPSPPPTFSTIIDLDHAEINALAVRLRKLLYTGPPTPQLRKSQLSLLQHLTYRLIRHDICEDLIMRPAFITHLPGLGADFAEHDRVDHERARATLIQLYADFGALSLSDVQGVKRLASVFGALMRELKEHMREESGREVPMLEAVLRREESWSLAQRYQETMVLGPELVVGGKRVWRDVGEYIMSDRGYFHCVWQRYVQEGMGVGKGRL